jgi:hypothetical protein
LYAGCRWQNSRAKPSVPGNGEESELPPPARAIRARAGVDRDLLGAVEIAKLGKRISGEETLALIAGEDFFAGRANVVAAEDVGQPYLSAGGTVIRRVIDLRAVGPSRRHGALGDETHVSQLAVFPRGGVRPASTIVDCGLPSTCIEIGFDPVTVIGAT